MMQYMANVANVGPGLIITNFRLHLPLDGVGFQIFWCHGDNVPMVGGFKRMMAVFEYSKLSAFGT